MGSLVNELLVNRVIDGVRSLLNGGSLTQWSLWLNGGSLVDWDIQNWGIGELIIQKWVIGE